MTDIILKVEHLKKTFVSGKTSFDAVDDLSFELRQGECLGIVGESGSGKSTVARMITGLLSCTEGKILFTFPKTQVLGKQSEKIRRRGTAVDEVSCVDIAKVEKKNLRKVYRHMQMVFQTPAESFDPRCTLRDGIGESLRNMGIKGTELKRKVDNLLELCGLSLEFGARYPYQVSGGQCQRAAIARALAVEPSLLICDEATSALDVTVQKQIMDLLVKLKKERELSVIFISHDLALVQMFCDRVIVMNQGKIVEIGTPDEVIDSPKEAYTKKLVDSVSYTM